MTICEAGTYVLSGGRLTITHCQGDGIQGEWVSISGDDTYVDITTEYENAGVNYYSSSLGSGNYNTLTSNNSTKTETVNVDTGSHKGIKAGTKSSTCSYTSVTDDSTLVAGQTYSTEASGGLVITGGTIIVDDSYTLYSGGSVSGSKLADSDYDFRYENCDTSSASVISTTTAGTTVQGGNSRP